MIGCQPVPQLGDQHGLGDLPRWQADDRVGAEADRTGADPSRMGIFLILLPDLAHGACP